MTEKAEALIRQLMKLGVQDPIAMNTLIRGHSEEGSPDSAFELLKIILRRKAVSERTAYHALVQSYLKKSDPSEAKAVLDSMVENDHLPDSSLCRSVMERLFEDGRVQTASRVMVMMLEKGLTDGQQDLFFKILEELFERGHAEEGLGRIELLMQSEIQPDFDGVLSVLCEKGKTIAALKLLDYCLERDYGVQVPSIEKVLDALLGAGKTLNAYSVLCKVMLKEGGVSDGWDRCKDLIRSLNEEGHSKQAVILFRMIKGKDKAGGVSKKGNKKAAMA